MTKSTITRERAQQIFLGNGTEPSVSEERELARMALAAMDSEHHTDDELSNLLWYSQEATCHSDPNYYCEFQRLATPGFIASIIRELQERRKADSEPVAWLLSGGGTKNVVCFDSGNAYADPLREVTPLYRHPQPAPVVSAELLHTAASAIEDLLTTKDRMGVYVCFDLPFRLRSAANAQPAPAAPVCTCPSGDGSLRWPCPVHPGNSPVIPDGWTGNEKANAALMMLDRIETVDPVDDDRIDGIKRIVRELATAQHDTPALNSVQSVVTVPGKWIPVSERMPEVGVKVLCFPAKDEPIHAVFNGQLWLQDVSWSGSEEPIDNVIPVTVTHWMPLPAGPQEVR
ncbi:DUF551 domain-containing protein [Klebsiella pneumoniae]|nr:DUF551 domain-containing protein [Klebsiella pneumoniae]MDZ6186478.1 DUF551 domain-containing protein [Klebsiella pneumoniae]MDZ6208963.1 DUF551 domain-containing protein [Klebsiella pneumoniae]